MASASIPTTKSSITINFINSSLFVRTTKVDSILKAIINNLKVVKDSNSDYLIEYINTLRIIYYISRLDYYNKDEKKVFLSK